MKTNIIDAHKYSRNNRENVIKSHICGCFYCLRIFKASEVTEWIDGDTKNTALCPYCGIDSVIPGNSCYLMTKEFMNDMKKYWFSVP